MSHPLDQLLQSMTHSSEDDVLKHWGVKGMKWDNKKKRVDHQEVIDDLVKERNKVKKAYNKELVKAAFKKKPRNYNPKKADELYSNMTTLNRKLNGYRDSDILGKYDHSQKNTRLSRGLKKTVRSFKNAKSTAWKATSAKAKKIGKMIDGLFGR